KFTLKLIQFYRVSKKTKTNFLNVRVSSLEFICKIVVRGSSYIQLNL
ncbi:hypothetical protein LEP1GSC116_2571, partial [Leptospira interrogans serovar Icterohaemorrhagiae str. Verdun HP]